MKDKIKDILDKIIKLSHDDCFNKQWMEYRYLDVSKPQKKEIILFNLFDNHSCSEFDLDIFEKMIIQSKEISKKYYNSKLVIADRDYNKKIVLYYYETEQEIYDRLSLEYELLLKEKKKLNDEEKSLYLKLECKYKPIEIK